MMSIAVQANPRTPASVPSQSVRRLSDRISPRQQNPATTPGGSLGSYLDSPIWAENLAVKSLSVTSVPNMTQSATAKLLVQASLRKRRRLRSPSPSPFTPQPREDEIEDNPFRMDEQGPTEEIILNNDPLITMHIPLRMMYYSETVEYVQTAWRLCSELKEAEKQQALAVATKEAIEVGTRRVLRTGMNILCNSNGSTVQSSPGVSRSVKAFLSAKFPESSPPGPLDVPSYPDIEAFMCEKENLKQYKLGQFKGKDFIVSFTRGVRLEDWVEGDFGGRVEITFKSGEKVAAYCVGPVIHTGTGLLLLEDERRILITPEDASYPAWEGMEGKKAAWVSFDGGQISLTSVDIESVVSTEYE